MIGGSLALALRERRPDCTVQLWARRESACVEARELLPEIRVTTDPVEAAQNAEILVFCTPVSAMHPLAETLQAHIPEDAVLTDAGSVKSGVVRLMEAGFRGRFAGSHPMAGSEKSGLQAARSDLFQQAACVITPTPVTAPETLERVRNLWRSVGGRTLEMAPEIHDRLAARISHLPHAVAAALVNAIHSHAPEAVRLAGGGYRDSTRIASGPASLWRGILLENRQEVLAALEEFTGQLDTLKRHLASENAEALEAFLADAGQAREKMP